MASSMIYQMKRDTLHMTCDTCQITCDMGQMGGKRSKHSLTNSGFLKFARKRISYSVSQSVTKLFVGQPWQHGSVKEALTMNSK